MDQDKLVVDRIDEGRKLLDILSGDRLEVSAAFWLSISDEGRWSLHIVSPTIDRIGMKESYVVVIGAIDALKSSLIDVDDVTLLRTNNHLSVAILDFLRGRSAPLPTRERGTFIGDILIDQAYIYSQRLAS